MTYELRPGVVNGSLSTDSSGLGSISTGDGGTYMSSGFTTSLVCQDTSSDEDADGQSLCPHTGLNNLPQPTNQSEPSEGGKGPRLHVLFATSSDAYPS